MVELSSRYKEKLLSPSILNGRYYLTVKLVPDLRSPGCNCNLEYATTDVLLPVLLTLFPFVPSILPKFTLKPYAFNTPFKT